MIQKKELYESGGVWDQNFQLGQENLVKAILDFMPGDVCNVLDVGCGDGKITGRIAESARKEVVGLDSSPEALSRCKFKTVIGDSTAISYPDDAFDMVMTTDMLEHLPASIEERSWSELFRVAARYVMVAVPFREELLDGTTRCPDCGTIFHVNWHMRSYDWPQLLQRAPPDWCLEAVVLTGEPWSAYHPIETRFRRHVLGEYAGWSEAICPQCGGRGTAGDQAAALCPQTAAWLGRLAYRELAVNGAHRLHSEILVLFKRKACSLQSRKLPVLLAAAESCSASSIKLPQDLPEVNLVPFPASTRAVRASSGGLVIQFPVYDHPTELTIDTNEESICSFPLQIEDGEGSLYSGVATLAAATKSAVPFDRAIVSGYYGLLVRLPNIHSGCNLELKGGLPGVLLTGGSPSTPAYYPLDLAGANGFVQITKSTWINPGWLTHPANVVRGERCMGFLDEITHLADCERDRLQSECVRLQSERDRFQLALTSIQQRPEVRWSSILRRKISSLRFSRRPPGQ